MSLPITPIDKNEQFERLIRRLENMLLAESVEKKVLDNEMYSIYIEMIELAEYNPELVDFFNKEMKIIMMDIVDLSCMRSEFIKNINEIELLKNQVAEKAKNIVKRFNLLEQKLKEEK